MKIDEFIASETAHIHHLEQLVRDSISEEAMLSSKLLDLEKEEKATLGQKVADAVADFGGSWAFVITFLGFMLAWIAINTAWFLEKKFDPYPFILLNLILSCLAALQAPIIMMSQNRQEAKDRRRARSDYMINLKAELEVRGLHQKVDLLIAEEMKTLFRIQQSQMEQLTQISQKLDQLKT